MTTDYAQQQEAAKRPKKFVSRGTSKSFGKKNQMELTRSNHFIEGKRDIFDLLAEQARENKQITAKIDKTVAFLNKTQKTIESAEQKINAQTARIHELEHLNTIDELTGLNNRLGFEAILKRELARTKRQPQNAGIVLIIEVESHDLVKERYGEKAANVALRLVGRILSEETRLMDAAGRISENSFALLMSGTAADQVLERAQKLALRVNNLSAIWNKQEIKMHASLGMKAYSSNDTLTTVLPTIEGTVSR